MPAPNKDLLRMPDILRSAGLTVVEHEGWQTRGNTFIKPFQKVESIICHHTASNIKGGNLPSLNIVKNGRPGIPGCLSQLMIGRDGVWHVISAGLCYHAGKVKAAYQDNWHAIGVEAENNGIGEPWSPVLYNSYVKGVKALSEGYKVPNNRILGHKEVSLIGKIDPSFDMNAFRQKIAGLKLKKEDTKMEYKEHEYVKVDASLPWAIDKDLALGKGVHIISFWGKISGENLKIVPVLVNKISGLRSRSNVININNGNFEVTKIINVKDGWRLEYRIEGNGMLEHYGARVIKCS